MDWLQKIGGKAKDIGENLGEKAMDITKRSGELIETGKLKYEISKLEKEIENNFKGIGLLYYQKYQGCEDLEEELERLCQATGQLEKEIKKLEEEIEKLTPKSERCSSCNVDLPQGSKFCSYCGQEISPNKQ